MVDTKNNWWCAKCNKWHKRDEFCSVAATSSYWSNYGEWVEKGRPVPLKVAVTFSDAIIYDLLLEFIEYKGLEDEFNNYVKGLDKDGKRFE